MVWLNLMVMCCQSTTLAGMAAKVQDVDMADVKALTGDRVTLRAPRLEDAEELFASVASDPEVPRYMSWIPHPDRR